MNTKAFLSWCASQGISTPLQLRGDDSYRYLACESDFAGDVVTAPLGACLTADTKESLAELLAHERSLGPKSKFAPYIDVLPTIDGQLGAMPRFWRLERLGRVTDGGQVERKIAADANAVEGLDPWALACVSSRTNFLTTSNFMDDFKYAMTPMLDMLNHDPTVGTRARVEGGALILGVDRAYLAGEEVFISYGDLSNLETLCDYGFILPDNPCNDEVVDIRLIHCDPFPVTVFSDGSISDIALMTLRRYLANEEEMESQGDTPEVLAFAKPVSIRNEEEVLAFLSVTLDDAVIESRSGAQEADDDEVVSMYLSARAQTLEKGLKIVERKLENCL